MRQEGAAPKIEKRVDLQKFVNVFKKQEQVSNSRHSIKVRVAIIARLKRLLNKFTGLQELLHVFVIAAVVFFEDLPDPLQRPGFVGSSIESRSLNEFMELFSGLQSRRIQGQDPDGIYSQGPGVSPG